MKLSSVLNVSVLSSVLMAVYVGFAAFNIYRLMHPLSGVNLQEFGEFVVAFAILMHCRTKS